MPIPSGVDKKRSKVYIEKTAGDYLQILPETFCESEILEDSLWPVSSHALKLYSNSIEERIAPFAGATALKAGNIGTVPQAEIKDRNSFLRGDGKWIQVNVNDEKVKTTPRGDRKYYVSGTELSSQSTGGLIFDPNVYVDQQSGELHASKFIGSLEGNVSGNIDGIAAMAMADGEGNSITETYVQKNELSTYAASQHTHSSSDIVNLQGYAKGTNSSAILNSDTLNSALGKLEVRLGNAAPLSSPGFSGTPTAPTPTGQSAFNQVANKEYVDSKVAEIVGGAGDAFNTLKELEQALGSDASFASTMSTKLGEKLDKNSANYVKTVTISNNTAGSGQILKLQRGDDSIYTLLINDTVVNPATAAPLGPASAAKVGTSLKYAREDHVHPFQDTVVSNATNAVTAEKANKLTTPRKLRTNLASTTAVTFDGTEDQLNIPVTGILPIANGGTGATNLNGFVQTANINQTISGTKTFSNTIVGSISGNAATATTAGKVQATPAGTSWVAGATAGKALVNATTTGYGALLNAPTKDYRVALSTYPSNNNLVYLYSVTNANISAGSNTVAKSLTWNADTGELTANSFKGTLNGTATSCSGNAATATQATKDGNGNVISTTYLPLAGGTVTGTLNLTRTTDAQGTGTAAPALRIGALTGAHLEFDGNEIMAKASGNTTGPLYINNDGGSVVIGPGGLTVGGTITGQLKGNADTATKLGTATVGGTAKPIYLNNGSPAAISATAGSVSQPVYLNAGTISACTGNVGNASTPVYMSGGKITACTSWRSPNYKGATSSAAGTAGLVPAATSTQYRNFFRADGTWQDINFTDTVAMSSTETAINLSKGCVFTKTITANTTFTITGVPSGKSGIFNLVLTNGGSKTIVWPASVKWAERTPPALTSSGKDLLTFLTPDGGTTWFGMAAVIGAA